MGKKNIKGTSKSRHQNSQKHILKDKYSEKVKSTNSMDDSLQDSCST